MNIRPKLFSIPLLKYALREVLPSFFGGTAIFLLVLLMFQVIRLSEFAVEHQIGILRISQLIGNLLLSFLPIAVPVSFLFSILMAVSRAQAEGEVLSLQASGFSVMQIFVPYCGLSLVVSAVCLYLSLYMVPRGNRAFELMMEQIMNEKVISALKPGTFLTGFFGFKILAEEVIPIKNEFKNVFLYDDREPERPLTITARYGLLKREPEQGILTLRLSQGTVYIEKKLNSTALQKIDFQVYDINLDTPKEGSFWRNYSLPSYQFPQLLEKLETSKKTSEEYRQYVVELHRRFCLALSCFVFSALGFFIGLLSQRGFRNTVILFCLLVGLIYWLSYIVAVAVAASGKYPASICIWTPNLFFLFVSYLCYRKYQYR